MQGMSKLLKLVMPLLAVSASNKIRNHFAHRLDASNYQSIKDAANNLRLHKKYPVTVGAGDPDLLNAGQAVAPVRRCRIFEGQLHYNLVY
jgi:hypothetical protein